MRGTGWRRLSTTHALVYLTLRDRQMAAIKDVEQFQHVVEDAEEPADIHAADEAWAETERAGETPIPGEDVKRGLGVA